MSPWEEDNDELVDDIGVGDIKVVLQGGDIDITIELGDIRQRAPVLERVEGTNVLFHVLLTSHNRTLTDLETHLSRRIIHDSSKCWVHVIALLSHACLSLLSISVALLLWLLLRDRRRR